MATGFVERYKGKVASPPGGVFVGGNNIYGVQSSTVAGNNSTLGYAGVVTITSTASAVYRLAQPIPGVTILFHSLPSSSFWLLTGSTVGVGAGGQNFTITGCPVTQGGSSITNTIKSTTAVPVSGFTFYLEGISTSQYAFAAGSTTSPLLFSTTT